MEQYQADQHLRLDDLKPAKRAWFLRIRYQFLITITLAVALPIAIRFQSEAPSALVKISLYNTLIAMVVAVLLTLFSIRRLGQIPGYAKVGYLIVTVAVVYGMIAVFFLMFRFDYSRFLFLASYSLFTITVVLMHMLEMRVVRQPMAVIPGGNTKMITLLVEETNKDKTSRVDWHFLSSPEGYQQSMGPLIADLRYDHSEQWERFMTEAAIKGVPVYHIKQIREALSGKVEIDHLSENNFGSIIPDHSYLRIKQIADFCLAAFLLPLVLLIIGVLTPVIRRDTGGSAIFTQKRMGFRGKKFFCYKLRTMRTDAYSVPHVKEPSAKPEDTAKTRDNDERITNLGRFLRKYRIDELPQIFNIMKGEMSWIGPRPEAVPLSLIYEEALPFYRYRHIVRPGISGWAQINQGHVTETDQVLEKLHYDFFYIKHVSLALDLVIVIRTILTILRGFGAR